MLRARAGNHVLIKDSGNSSDNSRTQYSGIPGRKTCKKKSFGYALLQKKMYIIFDFLHSIIIQYFMLIHKIYVRCELYLRQCQLLGKCNNEILVVTVVNSCGRNSTYGSVAPNTGRPKAFEAHPQYKN